MSRRLTATSYAILGLLAIRPWTTYELTQQMQRSLRRFWPRAESKLYEEPRKLGADGLATAMPDPVGRRTRTRYSVTPEGRHALAQWLAEPSSPPTLESEHLLKVFFAEHGTKEDLRATLEALRDWARERAREDADIAESYLSGSGQFPARTAQLALVGRYISDFAQMSGLWAEWAEEVIDGWPEEIGRASPPRQALQAIAQRRPEGGPR